MTRPFENEYVYRFFVGVVGCFPLPPLLAAGVFSHPALHAHCQVGDFVRFHENEECPADVLVVDTSDATGMCYIETANLDGETNLKIRSRATLPRPANVRPAACSCQR
jgi:hypothetical protein